jgi:phage baseplate assembly protein W
MSVIKTTTPKYIDLDLNFKLHPVTKDVSRRIDRNAIITSVINLCKTRNGERPFHPEIGCQANSLLFEQFTHDVKAAMERSIKYCINNFEPRVEVTSVLCREDRQSRAISVTVIFRIIASGESVNADFFLERTI